MRTPVTPIYRGPQAVSGATTAPVQHAPNAALLIDFDNVTMGIRSDLASELRNLLSSDIIKGKVAVQRAYADWRRYPQYIVPLAESSIDMIMAPAYGSSKKNATDIRLAVDAMELVFTRPEIGTYILLSGDSDFASLVTKLKEYGKYVIGVGIRESSSDLLVMNCDEYYSYNALAGLVKAGEEEVVKWDPWELVVEAINRMVKNGDVMRSDRLKQVMQDIDPTFDEKNLGMSKFSKFCQEAAAQGLIKVTKLENGQLEVAPADEVGPTAGGARAAGDGRQERRKGRAPHRHEEAGAKAASRSQVKADGAQPPSPPVRGEQRSQGETKGAPTGEVIGSSGERLTRDEAFDLVKRAVASLSQDGTAVLASTVRRRAFELLGRDSESLSQRNFHRILRDAHDAEVIDLRRRGDDYEVALPVEVPPVAEQLNRAAAARTAAPLPGEPAATTAPRGIAARGRVKPRRDLPPPEELLSVGVVEDVPPLPEEEQRTANPPQPASVPPTPRSQRSATRVRRKRSEKDPSAAAAAPSDASTEAAPAKKGRRSRRKAATKA
jgi:uncharacterized protein (TIGR00288 family)